MPQPPEASPSLLAFYVCDDVRFEQGGKVTVVGTYGKAMRFPTLPATLPKLCFVAEFEHSLSKATSVRVRLIKPSGGVVFEAPQAPLGALKVETSIPEEYRLVRLSFQVAPMVINEEGLYTVEIEPTGFSTFRANFFVAADATSQGSATSSAPTSAVV